MLPVTIMSSVKEIPAESPPVDSKLSAYIVPDALILPEAVMWVAVKSPSTVNNELPTVAVPIAILSADASTNNKLTSVFPSILKSWFCPPSFITTPPFPDPFPIVISA